VERAHARVEAADSLSAVPRLDAAPQHDLRRRTHRVGRVAQHPHLRPLVRHVPLGDSRVEPSERPALHPVRVIMRITTVCFTVALALAPLATSAQTTTPPPQEMTPATTVPSTGIFDFGVRGTNLNGDAARYERYRALGSGLFLEGVRVGRQRSGWLLSFSADHVGWSDQRFVGNAERLGTFKSWFIWDQIPMLFSRTTRTLFTGIGSGQLQILDAVQTQVQAQPSAISPLFSQFGSVFETETQRHIAEGGFSYDASRDLTLNAKIRYTTREGTIP